MRKLLAIWMSATLLTVSAVPILADAAACAMPEHASAMEAMDEGHQHHHMMMENDAHATHGHAMERTAMQVQIDWQSCRIECGCGCHNNVDSLPQLLAPHIVSNSDFALKAESPQAVQEQEPALEALVLCVPSPPPQLS